MTKNFKERIREEMLLFSEQEFIELLISEHPEWDNPFNRKEILTILRRLLKEEIERIMQDNATSKGENK